MEFKTFITEGKRDTVVFSHGCMNPVTIGHQKMVEAGHVRWWYQCSAY
jgi:hypothetical protein